MARLAASGATDWSSGGGYIFNGNKSSVEIDSDTINAGNGSDHIYGQLGVVLPQLGSATGLVTSFYAYPSGEPGGPPTANYNYVYGFGQFGSLQPWKQNSTAPSKFDVDADTITGGAGNNVIFGELGDDTITGGSGNDDISGGWGFNTLSGGGGTNQIVFNRATDTHIASGGGNDIAVSSLDVAAASPILQVVWTSTLGAALAAAMTTSPPTPPSAWQGTGALASGQGGVDSFFVATSFPPLDPFAPPFAWAPPAANMASAFTTSTGATGSGAGGLVIFGAAEIVPISANTAPPSASESSNADAQSAAASPPTSEAIVGPATDDLATLWASFETGFVAQVLGQLGADATGDMTGLSSIAQADWFAGPDAGSAALSPTDSLTPSPAGEDDQGIADGQVPLAATVAREIVSPGDIIRAIRNSEIAIKVSDPGASGNRIWLFDETEGAFVARDPERMTIVIDGGDAPRQLEQSFGQVETPAAPAALELSWLGALRHFGREAARTWFDL
jgi:hypothetical protein